MLLRGEKPYPQRVIAIDTCLNISGVHMAIDSKATADSLDHELQRGLGWLKKELRLVACDKGLDFLRQEGYLVLRRAAEQVGVGDGLDVLDGILYLVFKEHVVKRIGRRAKIKTAPAIGQIDGEILPGLLVRHQTLVGDLSLCLDREFVAS